MKNNQLVAMLILLHLATALSFMTMSSEWSVAWLIWYAAGGCQPRFDSLVDFLHGGQAAQGYLLPTAAHSGLIPFSAHFQGLG